MSGKTMAEVLAESLFDRGHDVRAWPEDEAAAYRDNGRFQAGNDAATALRFQKAAAALTAAGFGDVRAAAAAGVFALENAAGANGRVTIKSLEAVNVASDMLKGEWDGLIKMEMDFHPRRLPARTAPPCTATPGCIKTDRHSNKCTVLG